MEKEEDEGEKKGEGEEGEEEDGEKGGMSGRRCNAHAYQYSVYTSELLSFLPGPHTAICPCTYLHRAVSQPRTRRLRDSTALVRTTRPPGSRDENSN